MKRGGDAFVRHDEFVFSRCQKRVVDTVFRAHIAVADWLADRVAKATAGQIADRFAIAQYGFPAKQHHVRVLGREAGQLLCQRIGSRRLTGLAANKRRVAAQFHRPAKPRLERVVIRRHIRTPCAITLFKPKGLDGPIADRPDVMGVALLHQHIENIACPFNGHMQFPAQLTHIGHAHGPHLMTGNLDLLHAAKAERVIAHICIRHRRKHVPRAGSHQRKRTIRLGHIDKPGIRTRRQMLPDPAEIMGARTGTGDDVEAVIGKARHGEVAFDATARVEDLRIGQASGWLGHIIGADPLKRIRRIRARHLVFGKGGLVEHTDLFAHMGMLLTHRPEPVLTTHGIVVARLHARGRKPVGPLPSELGAEHGAVLLQAFIEWRNDARAPALIFLMREPHGVVLAISFKRAFLHPFAVFVECGETANVDHPEIERRFAAHSPFGQHPARAAASRNAECIEACTNKHVGAFGRLAENEIAVGREALRPVDHLPHARFTKRGHTLDGLRHVLFEMIEIIVEKLELELVGHVTARQAGHPALRVRLIAAHHQTAHLFLEVDAPIGVAHGRRVGRKTFDFLSHDILVLHRMQRHRNAGHRADLARPLAAAVHHRLTADTPPVRLDCRYAVAIHFETGHAHALEETRTMHARALGERLGDVGGARLTVGRQP